MKVICLLLTLCISQSLFAKTVARVLKVEGSAFSFVGGKSYSLAYGNKISDMSEVMVEDSATLTLLRSDGSTFYITGGSYLKFYKHMTELKNGNVWVKLKGEGQSKIHTSNSIATFNESEFIYSFNNVSGKTQLLVLTGIVAFSNSLEPELKVNTGSGYFTMVDSSYENGLPRSPTRIGLKSYKKTKNLFTSFKSLQETKFENMMRGGSVSTRSIASIGKKQQSYNTKKRGRIVTIRTHENIKSTRMPASADAFSYYKSKITSKNKRVKKKSKKMRFFGFGYTPSVKRKSKSVKVYKKRKPASIKRIKTRVPASSEKNMLIKELRSDFESSLEQNFKANRRHSGEVNQLIDELNTYKSQYSKSY